MSIIGIRSKQLMEQHDYHEEDLSRIQARCENDMCADQYPTTGQQIRTDAILSRQLH